MGGADISETICVSWEIPMDIKSSNFDQYAFSYIQISTLSKTQQPQKMDLIKIVALLCLSVIRLQGVLANPLPDPEALTFEDLGNGIDKALHIQKEDQPFKEAGKKIGEVIDDFVDHPAEEIEKFEKEVEVEVKSLGQKIADFFVDVKDKIVNFFG